MNEQATVLTSPSALLQAALTQANEFLHNLERCEQAIRNTESEIRARLANIASAEKGLALQAERAADQILEGGSGVLENFSSELPALRESVEQLRASADVLRSRLVVGRAGAGNVLHSLQGALRLHGVAVLEKYMEEHSVVAQAYADSIEKGAAIGRALGVELHGINEAKIIHPRELLKELIPRRVYARAGGTLVPRWTTIPALQNEVDALASIHSAIRQLETEKAEADRNERRQRVDRGPSVTTEGVQVMFG